MAAFTNMEEDRGGKWISPRLAEIMRRDGQVGSGETSRAREGGVEARGVEGEKGLFPREGTICRENFKNATPWSGRNEISQRILIRLRPFGGREQVRYRLSDPPTLPPSRETRGRRVSCECRCQGKRTSYVSHRPTLSIGWNIEDREDTPAWSVLTVLLDRRTWRRLVSIYSKFDLFIVSIDCAKKCFIVSIININLSDFTLVYFYLIIFDG